MIEPRQMVDITEAELRQKIDGNIFRFAYGAVEPWDTFPWHLGADRLCDTWKPHASQALVRHPQITLRLLSCKTIKVHHAFLCVLPAVKT
jgi:hypothetical protein